MDKEVALVIKAHALDAIAQLTELLYITEDRCTPEEYEAIRRGVGISIGNTAVDLLEIVYRAYPELDDDR
ncbi:MAG: hypothetical protein ABIP75_00940 [Pyrinomonadaceae bacterium]